MAELELVCHLGRHVDDTAARLAALVGERTGLIVHTDPSRASVERRKVIGRGAVDLVWMCGYLTRRLTDHEGLDLEVVAAPVFTGQRGPVYHSVIVVRQDSEYRQVSDLGDARLVINEDESWSGHHAFSVHLADEGLAAPFVGELTESGSHAASLQALLDDDADCAAIDDTLWSLRRGELGDRLRVIGRTRAWPSPPVSVARRLDPDLRRAIGQALVAAGNVDSLLEAMAPATTRTYDEMARYRSQGL